MKYNLDKQERIALIDRVRDYLADNLPVSATKLFHETMKANGGINIDVSKVFIASEDFDEFVETGIIHTETEKKIELMSSLLRKITIDIHNNDTSRLVKVLLFCPLETLKKY
jgi:hypothetical protein